MSTKNDITGDSLVSKASTEAYRSNFDNIFGSKVRSKTMDNYKCETEHTDDDEDDDGYEICHRCSGSGEGMYDGSTCSYCKGTGEEPVDRGCDDFDFPEDGYDND